MRWTDVALRPPPAQRGSEQQAASCPPADTVAASRLQLSFPKLSDGSWDFDVLPLLQPLLTLNKVVDPVDQQLDQLHLNPHAAKVITAS